MTSTNPFYEGVKAFHEAFNHPVGKTPTAIPEDTAVKRAVWSAEELVEFLHATVAGDEKKFDEVIATFKEGIEAAVAKQKAIGPIPEDQVLIAQMDALTDELYFNQGSFVVGGVNPQPLFDIVQAANMAKLGADGKPIIRESDGKIMKPEGWEPPEEKLEAEIKSQITNSQAKKFLD